MHDFFAGVEYAGPPFTLFGTAHLVTLAVVLALNLALIRFRHALKPAGRAGVRYGLALVLLVNETLYHVWHLVTNRWTLQEMLPFHLCTILVYLSAFMLVTHKTTLYPFLYFLGIGAASQALLTPNAGQWGFPHFRFFQAMISHGAIVAAAVYMTVIAGCRPRLRDVVKIAIGMNLYMVVVQGVNMLVGSNYLWIARKPDIPTLIDHLGPWPWYIFSMQVVGLVTCLALYLPFAMLDWQKKR
jgi:hypothetical integral membrane protein (TIGR02206 family)